jgi:integrase
MQDDSYNPLWLLALATGMRLGELRGLRWCDVELARGALHVRQQITRVGRKDRTSEPKTNAGRRTISLPADAIEALKEHHTQRPVRPIALDPAQRDTDLVFAREDGTALDQDAISSRFNRAVARTKLKRITFHGMRHTHATLLLLAGVNVKAVSARLGHSSIQITLDTYAHLLPEMEQHAADAIGEALKRRA